MLLWLAGALLLIAFGILLFEPDERRDSAHWRK